MGKPKREKNISWWLILSCRLILSFVFVYAAVGKIADPAEFADAVAAFRILPISWVNVFAIILPWMELLAGFALLYGPTMRSGAFVLLMLNIVFIYAAASAMAKGLDIECGCFTLSRAHDKVGWSLIGRDIFFLLLCVPVLISSRTQHHDPRAAVNKTCTTDSSARDAASLRG